jgi:uncharacterized surface protein with fasciclin (FAS1) repeats
MKKLVFAVFAFALTFTFGIGNASAQNSMKSNDSKMSSKKNIVETAVGAENLSTLVAAVKAASLVETLSGDGPFTVFAPDNAAFGKLPEGTVATLVKPENKATLTKILTYHVVSGKYDAKTILKAIKKGNGKAMLTTVQGGTLTAMLDGSSVVLVDEKGGKSIVTAADVKTSNGVVHIIDSVVMPN